nr:F-box protein At5g49610-like [Ipomoea batatas]
MEFSDPPSDLLVEILARLPSSKAAIRLKLVCKSWCSLISSHYFITVFNHRRHDPIHRSSSSRGCFIFESAFDRRCLSMVRWGYHDAVGDFHRPDFSFLPCPQISISLMGSCGDLILCSTRTSPSCLFQPIFYYVCNLLTKQWAALPPAPEFQSQPRRNVLFSTGFLCVLAPCSLCSSSSSQCVVGHNNNNNNFMVVRICCYPVNSIQPQSKFTVQLFSSEEGEWKSVVVLSPRAVSLRVRSSATLVSYKGMLHWLVSGFVLVYDPYNCPEIFYRVIDTPNIIVGAVEQRFQTIGLFQDHLRITHVWSSLFYVWELEDYNMGKWSLVHTISRTERPRLGPLLNEPDHLPHLDPIVNLDPKIRDTGFVYSDGSAFYWTNSGWSVANGIVHWITHQWWPTPVPPLTACTIQYNENAIGIHIKKYCGGDQKRIRKLSGKHVTLQMMMKGMDDTDIEVRETCTVSL